MLIAAIILAMAALPSNSGHDHAPTSQDPEAAQVRFHNDAAQRLAAEPLEVARTYDALVAKDNWNRMQAYGELSASWRAAVWNHQLLLALAEHPEFTDEQRAVLYDALDLFNPEFFAITYDKPDWLSRVDQPLQKLEQRAKAAFGVALTYQLLAHLGPDRPPAAAIHEARAAARMTNPILETAGATSRKHHAAPNDLPNCSCSTVSDYCAAEFGSDWYCLGGGCVWGVNWGCGSALAYPCNGLCDLRQFQD